MSNDTVTVKKMELSCNNLPPEYQDPNFEYGFHDTVVYMKPDAPLPNVYTQTYIYGEDSNHRDIIELQNNEGSKKLTDDIIQSNPSDYLFVTVKDTGIGTYSNLINSNALNSPYTVKRNSEGNFVLLKTADRWRSGEPTIGATQTPIWDYGDYSVRIDNIPARPTVTYSLNDVTTKISFKSISQ